MSRSTGRGLGTPNLDRWRLIRRWAESPGTGTERELAGWEKFLPWAFVR